MLSRLELDRRVMLRRPDAARLAGAVLGLVVQCTAGQFPVPVFTDETFAPGVDHRNDWCDASKAVLAGDIVTADALRGRNVTVSWPAVENYSPKGFMITDETGALTDQGLMVEIMDELAGRAGFSWRNSYHFFQPPQAGQNYSWTEYVYSFRSRSLVRDRVRSRSLFLEIEGALCPSRALTRACVLSRPPHPTHVQLHCVEYKRT